MKLTFPGFPFPAFLGTLGPRHNLSIQVFLFTFFLSCKGRLILTSKCTGSGSLGSSQSCSLTVGLCVCTCLYSDAKGFNVLLLSILSSSWGPCLVSTYFCLAGSSASLFQDLDILLALIWDSRHSTKSSGISLWSSWTSVVYWYLDSPNILFHFSENRSNCSKSVIKDHVKLWYDCSGWGTKHKWNCNGMLVKDSRVNGSSGSGISFWNLLHILKWFFKNTHMTSPHVWF